MLHYTPESDQQWKLLTDKIPTTVLATLSEHKDEGDAHHDIAIISEHFRLETRSDPATLDGLTMDEASQIHRNEVGGSPMEMRNSLTPDHPIFWLADGEMLQSLGSGVLKVVQAAPIEGAYPECYYQWMTVYVTFLVDFWVALEICDSGLYDLIWEEQPGALWTGQLRQLLHFSNGASLDSKLVRIISLTHSTQKAAISVWSFGKHAL